MNAEAVARAWRAKNDRGCVLPIRVAVRALEASPGADVDELLRGELARIRKLDEDRDATLERRARVMRERAMIRAADKKPTPEEVAALNAPVPVFASVFNLDAWLTGRRWYPPRVSTGEAEPAMPPATPRRLQRDVPAD